MGALAEDFGLYWMSRVERLKVVGEGDPVVWEGDPAVWDWGESLCLGFGGWGLSVWGRLLSERQPWGGRGGAGLGVCRAGERRKRGPQTPIRWGRLRRVIWGRRARVQETGRDGCREGMGHVSRPENHITPTGALEALFPFTAGLWDTGRDFKCPQTLPCLGYSGDPDWSACLSPPA